LLFDFLADAISGSFIVVRHGVSRPCVYRKLKLGRSGDEVRPGWRARLNCLSPRYSIGSTKSAGN
jgi:hypothetical protein